MRFILSFILFVLTSVVSAQAPNLISYQAQVSDNSGLVTNRNVSIRMSILQGSLNGNLVYSENHLALTDANGVLNVNIGGGNAISGNFLTISWGSNSYFLKHEIDPNGGTNYSISGAHQLLSVPYAFYANNGVPSGGTNGQILTNCNGTPMWTTDGVCPGLITSLDCQGATNNGILISGIVASSVNSVISYSGGNGGTYSGQTVNSTGVTGLTASLSAGSFTIGEGSLTYNIAGTPSSNGTANFALNIGGQTCNLTLVVNLPIGSISTLNCSPVTNNGTLTSGVAATTVTSVISYTGGNGGTHSGQTVNSTGVTGLTATLGAGSFAIGDGNLTYNITGTPSSSGTANFVINIGGQTCTLSRSISSSVGTIESINCAGATNNGSLTSGVAASSVNSIISYSGGNGGIHNGQVITSTGVLGLTATLNSGVFVTGSGTLTYNITGTPNAIGTATFIINIGGQSCTLTRSVNPSVYPTGTVYCSQNPTVVMDVTNPTTGKMWMDRNLGATQVASSSTDANAYGDLYQWGRRGDGHQCRSSSVTTTLSSTDTPPNANFIRTSAAPNDWRSPQNTSLWQGVNGINNPCPSGYRIPTSAELDAERISWSNNSAQGAFASPLKIPLSGYRNSSGSLLNIGSTSFYWSSTVASNNSRYLRFDNSSANMTTVGRAFGFSVRCIKDQNTPSTTGSIGTLNCDQATNNGTLTSGIVASNVSSSIQYTNGNGGTHSGQIVTSTGVTGLTATLVAGSFANGAGNLTYTISGTPSTSGIANFALNIGGKSCNLSRSVSVPQPIYSSGSIHCGQSPTLVVDVINPTTGKTWMDRNIGASRVAESSTDAESYGDLFQWGRGADGHQCRTSTNTSQLSSSDAPQNGNFILAPSYPNDWRSPQNIDLWQGVNGVNNPCPNGYRLPTEGELIEEESSWSSNYEFDGFNSPLKFTFAGLRDISDDNYLRDVGTLGHYWSSTVNQSNSQILIFGLNGSSFYTYSYNRTYGASVRCIKEQSSSVYPQNSVNCLSTPTAVVEVLNPSTGRIWMDRNLGASRVATSSTDDQSYGDLYQWGRPSDGHQCRNSANSSATSSSNQPSTSSFIISTSLNDWLSPQNANLWQGLNGINNPCPTNFRLPTSSEWEAELASWTSFNSNGAFQSPLKLTVAGYRFGTDGTVNYSGSRGHYWSSTASSWGAMRFGFENGAGMADYDRAGGRSIRCIKDQNASSTTGSIGTLNCDQATNNGALTSGIVVSNVSSSIQYTNGNGGTHSGQTVTSTGVTGLTATLTSGTFASGTGNLTYTITGTPSASGTASFALNIGGQSCSLSLTVTSNIASQYPAGSVFCASVPTAIVDVTNPTTGKTWMDRNLGASQVATSSTDANAYGDLYQWGRRADGHQCRTSLTTNTLSTIDQPAHGSFILSPYNQADWRNPQNDNLWQGVNGINNPCPSGYRLPTETELNAERTSWSSNNAAGAFTSPLKLTLAGQRNSSGGLLNYVGGQGGYWSNTIFSSDSRYLYLVEGNAFMNNDFRASGYSVRCIKE